MTTTFNILKLSISMKFDVKCSDPNAIPIGKNQNIFDARCECGKNYKSTSSFQGKVLRDNIDVCVKCEEKEGTGDCVRGADGPTASPTSQPSMLKITPSPSAEPSINKSPSDSPSIVPSMTLGSLFDGQNCHYDGECQTGTCSGSVCEPGVSRNSIYFPIILSNCTHSSLQSETGVKYFHHKCKW